MPTARLWHATRENAAPSGIARYEGVLADANADGWRTDSVFRPAGRVRGCTPVSWLVDYRAGDADLVHATAATAAVPALLRRSAPLVVSSHGPIPVRYPELRRDAVTEVQWRLQPAVMRRADAVLANSMFTKRECYRVYGISPSKVSVVPLGVDLDQFAPTDGGRFDGDALILSSTLSQKRMDVARQVARALPDVRFLKAGYGEALAGEPNVHTVGWVAEDALPDLYSAVDVLVHPSEYESFGLPLLEAMACGTPVVAQDRTAIPEVVGERGGVLVEPGDGVAERMTAAVRRVLAGDGEWSPRARAERFPWSRTVRETVAVWDDVV